jgi:hypothetical protein
MGHSERPAELGFGALMPVGGASGQVMFRMREEYSGLLLPLVPRSTPDLSPSFARFTRGLKQRAETGG